MDFNYEVIAKMAADISKQMLKLHNQLDKVIDKQNELPDSDKQKQVAIELINNLHWEEASKLCAEQAKELAKGAKLEAEESKIRLELETLRKQLTAVSNGETPAPSTEDTPPETTGDSE